MWAKSVRAALTCRREPPIFFTAFAIRSKLRNVPKPHRALLASINPCSTLFVSVRTVTGDLDGNARSANARGPTCGQPQG
ncbi:hypothetical protein E4U58_002652 [Claviceps cyperi]|nr:hypothetical protein E4U58_002652 [Claviceps cyperi]